jgi:hypothetical protein
LQRLETSRIAFFINIVECFIQVAAAPIFDSLMIGECVKYRVFMIGRQNPSNCCVLQFPSKDDVVLYLNKKPDVTVQKRRVTSSTVNCGTTFQVISWP